MIPIKFRQPQKRKGKQKRTPQRKRGQNEPENNPPRGENPSAPKNPKTQTQNQKGKGTEGNLPQQSRRLPGRPGAPPRLPKGLFPCPVRYRRNFPTQFLRRVCAINNTSKKNRKTQNERRSKGGFPRGGESRERKRTNQKTKPAKRKGGPKGSPQKQTPQPTPFLYFFSSLFPFLSSSCHPLSFPLFLLSLLLLPFS